MFDHISLGVRSIARSKEFYDAALKPLGYSCESEGPGSLGYGKDGVALWLSAVAQPIPTDPQNGLHLCFAAPSADSVAAFHRAALAHGGRDNGKPSVRKDYAPDYYAAFVVDPDGYRLEAYCKAKP